MNFQLQSSDDYKPSISSPTPYMASGLLPKSAPPPPDAHNRSGSAKAQTTCPLALTIYASNMFLGIRGETIFRAEP
jgi:hypothetical protein